MPEPAGGNTAPVRQSCSTAKRSGMFVMRGTRPLAPSYVQQPGGTDMEVLYYVVIALAWTVGGFISGVTSMGCSLIAMPC